MAQRIRRELTLPIALNSMEAGDVSDFFDQDWLVFRSTVVSRNERECPIGDDATARRKRAASDLKTVREREYGSRLPLACPSAF
jgi:hypothetical protein